MKITRSEVERMKPDVRLDLDSWLWDIGVFYLDGSGIFWTCLWIDIKEGEVTSHAFRRDDGSVTSTTTTATNVQPPSLVREYLRERMMTQ